MTQRRSVFFGLPEADHQRLDRLYPGALGEILECFAAVGQIGELGGGQADLLGEFRALGAEFRRDFRQRAFESHAGLDAYQQKVQCVRPSPLNRRLTFGDSILHINPWKVETDQRCGNSYGELR